MTFEEFFIKKKIDLHQLQDVEPNLYREFKSHYALMGEKSFDHSKKYWFNRLRRSFHLSEDVPLIKAVSAATLSAPPPAEEKGADKRIDTPAAAKPTGFKPRFKATVTASKEEETPTVDTPTQQNPTEGAAVNTEEVKPLGFKPRFKTGVTKKAVDETEKVTPVPPKTEEKSIANDPEVTQEAEEKNPESKPLGFKPRFKAGVTKKAVDETEKVTPVPPKTEEKSIANDPEVTQEAEGKNPESKPLGFKPRFKAGVTKKAADHPIPVDKMPIDLSNKESDEEEQAATKTNSAPEDVSRATETKIVPKKPLGFTPRFKAKGDNKDKPREDGS